MAANPGLEPDMIVVQCGGPATASRRCASASTRAATSAPAAATRTRPGCAARSRMYVPPVRLGAGERRDRERPGQQAAGRARDLRCLPTRCPAPGASGGCRSAGPAGPSGAPHHVPCCDPSPMTMCAMRPAVVPCAPCSPASSPTSASSRRATAAASRSAAATRRESIAIGASIACDGACLTATEVRAGGQRLHVHGRRLQRDAEQDHARRLAARPRINLERALKAGDELGGHIVVGACRRRRPHRRHPRPTATSRRFTVEVPARPCPLHRAQGLGGARRHLAHRQRGRCKTASASTSSRTP